MRASIPTRVTASQRDAVNLPNNAPIKAICVVLMGSSGLICVVGHGAISILLGVTGVVFAIEGFWGAVKYDVVALQRFLRFLGVFILISLCVGIISLRTIGEYCVTAAAIDVESCESTARFYGWSLIVGGGLVIVPGFAVTTFFFVRHLQRVLRAGEFRLSYPEARRPDPFAPAVF
jgi:hypothetical protein